MYKIVSVHSFRHGTGKSSLVANLATLLTLEGRKVGVIDADLGSPSLPVLFGLGDAEKHAFNDYLHGQCDILEAAYDITSRLHVSGDVTGQLFLIPASAEASAIARLMRERYDVGLLNQGFHRLIVELELDMLLIDTHAGLNEETLALLPLLDTLVILLRHDQRDYQGTGVTVKVARKLGVPRITLIANEVPSHFVDVKAQLEQTYDCQVAGVLPHSDELMALASRDLFVLRYPDHPFASKLQQIATHLMT